MIDQIVKLIMSQAGRTSNASLIRRVLSMISDNLNQDQILKLIKKLRDIYNSTSNEELIILIEEILDRIDR